MEHGFGELKEADIISDSEKPARFNFGKIASIVLPLLLGIALIIYQYRQFSPAQIDEMRGYFKTADYFYINISLFIALFGYLSRAYRWKFALAHMGYKPAFHNSLIAVCIAYFINLTIPRSGEISRAIVMKKYENIPFDKAFGTIVAERIVDFALFLLFVIGALLFQFNVLRDFISEYIPIQKLVMLSLAAILFMIVFLIAWIYSKWGFILSLKRRVAGLREGIFSVFLMKDRWAFLFHSVFIWFTYLLMFYVTIFALPETSTISMGAVMTAFVFGTLAIGFTNSGFGAYPLLVSQIFLLYGVSDTAGTAFGWLVWISQTLLMVILGLLSFILLPILNRNK